MELRGCRARPHISAGLLFQTCEIGGWRRDSQHLFAYTHMLHATETLAVAVATTTAAGLGDVNCNMKEKQ
eukprot:10381071-Prorocentrum_lima.AAC.1